MVRWCSCLSGKYWCEQEKDVSTASSPRSVEWRTGRTNALSPSRRTRRGRDVPGRRKRVVPRAPIAYRRRPYAYRRRGRSGPLHQTTFEARRMTAQLVALCFDAHDPSRLARFWGDLLGWARADDDVALVPSDDTGFQIRFLPTTVPKTQQNPMHLELTSTSLDVQQQTVARALALGARHIDVGQLPEEGHVVLADPEGNELCVIEPGNQFLADCGFVGASPATARRRSATSGARRWAGRWSGTRTRRRRSARRSAVRRSRWGGPPLTPKIGKSRQHFDLAPPLDGDQHAEVDRLLSLGATASTSGRARCPGWSWPIRTVVSSVCCLRAGRDHSSAHCPTVGTTSLVCLGPELHGVGGLPLHGSHIAKVIRLAGSRRGQPRDDDVCRSRTSRPVRSRARPRRGLRARHRSARRPRRLPPRRAPAR